MKSHRGIEQSTYTSSSPRTFFIIQPTPFVIGVLSSLQSFTPSKAFLILSHNSLLKPISLSIKDVHNASPSSHQPRNRHLPATASIRIARDSLQAC